MEKLEIYIVIGMLVLFGISLVMPYVETKDVCNSLGLEYKSKLTKCVDDKENEWSLFYHPNEKLGDFIGHMSWFREDCAIKCIENTCSYEYGQICEYD